jgi:hypothetical protein
VQNAWPEDAMAVVAERLSQQGVIGKKQGKAAFEL